jgi:hypothetical protein
VNYNEVKNQWLNKGYALNSTISHSPDLYKAKGGVYFTDNGDPSRVHVKLDRTCSYVESIEYSHHNGFGFHNVKGPAIYNIISDSGKSYIESKSYWLDNERLTENEWRTDSEVKLGLMNL